MPNTDDDLLGTHLKDRGAKVDPGALGFPMTHRRTPGLRREEVEQRANVSAAWYTWLEQGVVTSSLIAEGLCVIGRCHHRRWCNRCLRQNCERKGSRRRNPRCLDHATE